MHEWKCKKSLYIAVAVREPIPNCCLIFYTFKKYQLGHLKELYCMFYSVGAQQKPDERILKNLTPFYLKREDIKSHSIIYCFF